MLVKDKYFRLFISENQIQDTIVRLGKEISEDYADKFPIFVVILNGAFMFAADLMRQINFESQITFVKFTSYQSMESSGEVDELIGLDMDIRNRHIVILEDIVDTGLTMYEVLKEIKKYAPASIQIAALLQKPEALRHEIPVAYRGFEIENKFVIGYGLDYAGFGRNFKELFILDETQKA